MCAVVRVEEGCEGDACAGVCVRRGEGGGRRGQRSSAGRAREGGCGRGGGEGVCVVCVAEGEEGV